jgi:hypothetical protein
MEHHPVSALSECLFNTSVTITTYPKAVYSIRHGDDYYYYYYYYYYYLCCIYLLLFACYNLFAVGKHSNKGTELNLVTRAAVQAVRVGQKGQDWTDIRCVKRNFNAPLRMNPRRSF